MKKKILNILADDSRVAADKIAVMLGEEMEKVVQHISDMEKDGTIVKYSAIINHEKIDDSKVEALIECKVSPSRHKGFDAIAEEIYKFDEVKSLYLMSGGFDLAVFVEGKSLKAVAQFVSEKLSSLDKILSTSTHFLLKRYKMDGVMLESGVEPKRLTVHE